VGSDLRLLIDAGPTENGHRTRGIGTVTRELLEALTPERAAEKDIEIGYLRRRPLASLQSHWHPRGWPAELSGADPRVPPRIANWWQPVDTAAALPADIAAAGADVFLATDPQAVPHARTFATVAILYDVVPLVFPETYLTRRYGGLPTALYHYRLRQLRRADWWVAISEATKQDAVRLAHFDPTRISVVPLGVDHRVFRAADPQEARVVVGERFHVTRPYFFFVGANDPRKNLSTLLDAYRSSDAASSVDLVIAGQPPPAAAAARGVHWLGHVDAALLPVLYAAALAFTFPSLYEGFGLPVLEAMACGTPVVTSPLAAIPEVGGDAVLYCDPRDVRAVRDALQRIATDGALRDALRARGRARAAEFTWSRTATAILDACRSPAAGRDARPPRAVGSRRR